MNKLCETKPNSKKPKMNITYYIVSIYSNNTEFLMMENKAKTNPNQTQNLLAIRGEKPKQSQTNPILGGAHLNQDSFKTILSTMHLNRFYCETLKGPTAELTGGEAHHLLNVYRLKTGDKVELFNGAGTLATALIEKATSKSVLLKVIDIEKIEKPDMSEITIAVSPPKGERFDWLLEKCTELGIDRVIPVIFERTVKQPKNPKAVQRWRNVTIAAAKQCRRFFLPQIDTPVTLEKVLSKYDNAEILAGSLDAKSPALIAQRLSTKGVIALIGPEGGITENEKQLLENCGAKFVRLTDTVLRIETAALAFAAILTVRRDGKVK